MFKLIVLGAVLAVAAANPGFLAAPLAYSAPLLSHGVVAAAPIARIAAPVAVSAPIARVAAPVAIPAPVAYRGAEITVHAEPVEQHGYKIVY